MSAESWSLVLPVMDELKKSMSACAMEQPPSLVAADVCDVHGQIDSASDCDVDGYPIVFQQFFRCRFLNATRIAGVAIIGFVRPLIARKHNLIGVNHDNIVATIHVRRIARQMLAPQPGLQQTARRHSGPMQT